MNNQIWRIRRTVQEYQKEMFIKEISGNFPTYPNSGKTYGILANTAEHEFDTTLLQPNRDLRAETAALAEEDHSLQTLDLPSFPNDSLLMDEQSAYYNSDVPDWYDRGMPPRDIYRKVDSPDEDPYLQKLDADWDDYDLRVGDPVHAFLDQASIGNNVVFDDVDIFESFVSKYSFTDEHKSREIKEYLTHFRHKIAARAEPRGIAEPIPSSITELLTASDEMKKLIQEIAEKHPSHRIIPDTHYVRSETSRFLRIITSGERWNNAVEWVETDPCISGGIKIVGLFLPEDDCVLIGQIPLNLAQSSNVIALGATPIYPVLKKFFNHLNIPAATVDPLSDEEKKIYFDEYMNMKIFQTTENQHFVSGDNGVSWDRLRDQIELFEATHDSLPLVVSSKKFIDRVSDKLDERGVNYIHFAKAIGTNQFSDVTGCIVYGCPHYGDQYVRQMAAFCDDFDAEPIRQAGMPTEWSTETSQEIYENMTKGTVFQTIMRVGRSTPDETVVWCETSMIPDVVPIYELGINQLTPAEQEVYEVGKGRDISVAKLHEETGYSKKHIYRTLYKLEQHDLVDASDGVRAAMFTSIVKQSSKTTFDLDTVMSDAKDLLTFTYSLVIRSCQSTKSSDPSISERIYILTLGGGMAPAQIYNKSDLNDIITDEASKVAKWLGLDPSDDDIDKQIKDQIDPLDVGRYKTSLKEPPLTSY